MAADGKEDDTEKARSEVSPETTNKPEESVVSKGDAESVRVGNGETNNLDEGKNLNGDEKVTNKEIDLNGDEKVTKKETENVDGDEKEKQFNGDEKVTNKETENGDGDEKEKKSNAGENGACPSPPQFDENEKKNAIDERDENEKKIGDGCGTDEIISSDENEKEITENAKDGDLNEDNGLLSDLTESEKKALMELRSKIEDAISSNTLTATRNEDDKEPPPVETDKGISLWGVPLSPSKDDERTNTLLLKFLRARDFKPNDALEMLKNTLRWRIDNKIDSIVDEQVLENDSDYDPVSFTRGLDREGHPICYNVYGVFADEKMYNKTFGDEDSRERFLRWRIKLLEKEIMKLDFRPGGISTLLQVNDLKNAPGPSRRDIRLATKRAVGIFQDNYPEFVARNIFINVPLWYYAFNALMSPFLMQRTKSKFVFSRPSRVTETLLKYITAAEIPVVYGGLRQENDPDFSTKDAASEVIVKAGATETVEIPTPEVGNTLMWDLTIVGWDVNYKEEFVPTDEGSYTVIVKKGRKISWQHEPIRNTFKNKEPGKLVITIENSMFKKKRVLYRYKTIINHSASTSST